MAKKINNTINVEILKSVMSIWTTATRLLMFITIIKGLSIGVIVSATALSLLLQVNEVTYWSLVAIGISLLLCVTCFLLTRSINVQFTVGVDTIMQTSKGVI